jgi:hypothetical protein
MSPEAISRRLRRMAGLYRLAQSLKNVRILGPAEPGPAEPTTGTEPRPKLEPGG